MSNAVGCGFDHRSGQTKKDQDMFLLMSKTNKKESDYKCCKLEIYKLTPSFRNSRLSSSERLCWVVWSITSSFTLIYPYPVFFILKYLLCHKWRKVPNFLHYYVWHKPSSKWHTDSLCANPYFCFLFFFVCLFFRFWPIYI